MIFLWDSVPEQSLYTLLHIYLTNVIAEANIQKCFLISFVFKKVASLRKRYFAKKIAF